MNPAEIARTSEDSQQSALFCWCYQNQHVYPELCFYHAIPNGGDRDKITAGKLKATGVKAGVLDTFLPCARHGFHGLYIEMKRPALKGKTCLSDKQVDFGNFATEQGYCCRVAFTWLEAVDILKWYLGENNC